ncbi:hypothetical protein BD779DRAFT_718656 [Infundibulicybe gibba]|nr:hypothetical protein BD779DRAFT_718656 [Infundibulicybe gibba]
MFQSKTKSLVSPPPLLQQGSMKQHRVPYKPPPSLWQLELFPNPDTYFLSECPSMASCSHEIYQPKKLKSSSANSTTSITQPQVEAAKKRANLKNKTRSVSKAGDQKAGGVLGGADYVSLMMGGRRKAMKEAQKLPQEES